MSKSSTSSLDIQKLAETHLGVDIEIVFNNSSTFALCIEARNLAKNAPQQYIKFIVIDLSKHSIIYQSGVSGEIKWFDDEHISVFNIPGVVRKFETANHYIDIINVKTKKSMNKIDFLKKTSKI